MKDSGLCQGLRFLVPGETSHEESVAVRKLEDKLADVLSTIPEDQLDLGGSIRLLRFLRGYKNDLIQAESAYRAHIKWRKTKDVDILRAEVVRDVSTPEEIEGYLRIVGYLPMNPLLRNDKGIPLRDRYGNLLAVDRYGEWDMKAVLSQVPEKVFERWYIQCMEYRSLLLDRLSRQERRVVKVTLIQDMAGLSIYHISHQALRLAQQTMGVARDNYPEGVSKIFILNTPWMFSTFWKGISTWMRPRTLEKVTILGIDYGIHLFAVVPREHLPSFLGGTCQSHLADVPKTGLLMDDRFALGGGRTTVEIPAGKKLSVSYNVGAGHALYWAWAIVGHDIGFSIKAIYFDGDRPQFLNSSSSNNNTISQCAESESGAPLITVMLLSYGRYTSERSMRGNVVAERNGMVTFSWDNSYSFFRAKTLHRSIEIIKPEDNDAAITFEQE